MASGSKKVIYAALAGNASIAVTKFAAATITGSSAMLTEAIHSVVDTGNQLLLLWGIRQSHRPPDEEFPLGYGKEVYFWSFVVAILVFAIGAGLSIYEGIKHLFDPHPVDHVVINYIVLAFAMVFEGAAWWIALRTFRKTKGNKGYIEAVHAGKDPTVFVVLFEDSAALLGLVVAFIGILLGQLTGNPYCDGTASVIIGLLLATVAIWLARETKGLLIGEAADSEAQRCVMEIVSEHPGVKRVNELVTMQMGPDCILVNVSVDFNDEYSSNEVEAAVADFNRKIKKALPVASRVFIETESWIAHLDQLRTQNDDSE